MPFLTLAVPNDPATVEAAKRVSRAMDPDVGGYYAFETIAKDAQGAEWRVYGFDCTDEFMAQAYAFKDHPDALLAAVNADIAARWVGEPEMTLAEVMLFTDNVRMSSLYGMQAGCDELGLIVFQ